MHRAAHALAVELRVVEDVEELGARLGGAARRRQQPGADEGQLAPPFVVLVVPPHPVDERERPLGVAPVEAHDERAG